VLCGALSLPFSMIRKQQVGVSPLPVAPHDDTLPSVSFQTSLCLGV
jgi:hypothetical protein